MRQILLVEDDMQIAHYVSEALKDEGFAVAHSNDGNRGLELALKGEFDCIVLDINLPGMNGLEICRRLREGLNTPILMLTAHNQRSDIVHGLKNGADDYLPKPFHIEELTARVLSLSRRAIKRQGPLYCWQNIVLDASLKRATRDGQPVKLAPREYSLLEYLFRHQGVACEPYTLIAQVWGNPDTLVFSKTVDVHVAYLRKKLGYNLIQTVPGHGYLIPKHAKAETQSPTPS